MRPTPTTILIFAVLILLAQSICHGADRYVEVAARVEQLRESPNCKVIQAGTSAQGRPIYALVVTDPTQPETIPSERIRVLLLCGQHGNEPSAVWSMLETAEELASTNDPYLMSVLGRVVVVLVPVVNPDGFAERRRSNSRGIDLNRGWGSPSQPETLAVSGLVDGVRPHVVVDQHEWLDNSSWKANSVEIAGYGNGSQHRLARLLADKAIGDMPQDGIKLHLLQYREGSDSALAHRSFTRLGICAMLVETSQSWSPLARHRAYKDFTLAMLTNLAFPTDGRLADAIAAQTESIKVSNGLLAGLYPSEQSSGSQTGYWAVILLAACYIMLRFVGRGERSAASPTVIVQSRRLALTDAVGLAGSPRMKVAVIKHCRCRPSDRASRKAASAGSKT